MKASASQQQLHVYPPGCVEIWVNEPRRAPRNPAPANLLRLWFPETVNAYDANDHLLWECTYETSRQAWRCENKAIHDMKQGRPVHHVLECSDGIDDTALVRRSVIWRDTHADLSLSINNLGAVPLARVETSICLQRAAAPEYVDTDNTATFVVTDRGFAASAELVIPPQRDCVYGFVGEGIELTDGAKPRLTEEALFVVSRDSRYVLGYAWRDARRLFLNRGGCTRCLHSDVELKNVPPHTEVRREGILFIHEGTLEQAHQRFRDWKAV